MSNYIVKIIPKHEQTVPRSEEREEILYQLRTLTLTNDIHEQLFAEVTFIDSGSNFEGIKCNQCRKILATEWWSEQMNSCSSNDFNDLSITTPCCHQTTSLNELEYIWPAGFAKYVIEIRNPNEDEVITIEKLINSKDYKLIRAHY